VRRLRILKWMVLGRVALLALIQLVPYGRDHTNPSGGRQIAWDSPRTRQLMTGARGLQATFGAPAH
jgi:hypothetical protein